MTNIPYQVPTGSLDYTQFNIVLDKIQSGLDTIRTLSLTTGSIAASGISLVTGSPYGYGITMPMTARSNISGGMWVAASGGLAYAAPVSSMKPVGVAAPGTNVASGGIVNVILHGVVPMIAEGTIVVANGCQPGAGAGLNTVAPHTTGSAEFYATLDAATSGTASVVFVVVK